jgi:hypothetical protein
VPAIVLLVDLIAVHLWVAVAVVLVVVVADGRWP